MRSLWELADMWDEQRNQSSEALQQWLEELWEENPSPGVMILTAYVYYGSEIAFTLGASLVDVLRIGQGWQRGGWGYAEDGLRLIAIAGPIARGARFGFSRIGRILRIDPGGGRCTWVAAARALRETGVRHWATVKDLARAAGISLGSRESVFIEELIPALRRLGARVSRLPKPNGWTDVRRAARNNGRGVLMFSVDWARVKDAYLHLPPASLGENAYEVCSHTLLAARRGSRVVLMDRTGAIVRNLRELEALFPGGGYRGIGNAVPRSEGAAAMAFVHEARLAEIGRAGVGGSLMSRIALEVFSMARPNGDPASPPQLRPGSTSGDGEIPIIDIDPYPIYTVQRGDTLWKLAQRFLGQGSRWREIWEYNKDQVRNPNLIRVGQRLIIPVDGRQGQGWRTEPL